MINISTSDRALMDAPLWRAEDLGRPIPDSEHAVSVAMPHWAHAVGYEEGDPAVVDRLACGYPRFVYHPLVVALAAALETRFAGPGEFCLPLPSRRAAAAAAAYLAKGGVERGVEGARIEAAGMHGVFALVAPVAGAARAMAYWQHTGRIVSSRLAAAMLRDGTDDGQAGAAAKQNIKAQLAAVYDVPGDHIYIFGTGMDAVTTAHELGLAAKPGARSVQYGFPYVDVLKVQQEFGPGAHFYPHEGSDALGELDGFIKAEAISSIVTEAPANPLLTTPDLAGLSARAVTAQALLIVDDTVATGLNIDVRPWADLIATSLTKNFSGHGDVMGGALIVNPKRPGAAMLRDRLAADFEDLLWWEDALVLEERGADFADRMAAINDNTLRLARFLDGHKAVEEVYYPGLGPDPHYEAIRRPHGGYGGLLSFLPRDCASNAAPIFDRLRINKGPSLGTNYTLACPYTILAHYRELDWAQQCGVSQWLIRVSVGLEDADELIARFAEILDNFTGR